MILTWGNAIYIYSKAVLAQYLIASAWSESLASGEEIKPWPWADTWPVARLRSAEQGEDLYVLAGSSAASLSFGPGHLDGTSSPGEAGTSVIAGHRDTHFSFLGKLEPGERISLQDNRGSWHNYNITGALVEDVRADSLLISPGKDELVLITCYPFDAIAPGGPLRYVVRGKPALINM